MAQWLEPPAHNRLVPGSNPGGALKPDHNGRAVLYWL